MGEKYFSPLVELIMKKWCLLYAKPHKEEFLWSEVVARDIDCFFPRIRVHGASARARKVRPYFPGYLFVNIDPQGSDAVELRWLPGSNGLVRFGGEPASVPDAMVNAIRRHVDALNQAGGEQLAGLQSGASVDIIAGPFQGYEAIFDSRLSGDERVRLLLKIVESRYLPVELPTGLIRPQKQRSIAAR